MNQSEKINIETLNEYLGAWLRWLRLRRAVLWAGRGLSIGLGISIIASIVLVLGGLLIRSEYIAMILSVSAFGAGLASLGAYLWPVSRLRAAQVFDVKFGLRERVSTAFEIAACKPDFGGKIRTDQPETYYPRGSEVLVQRQLEDAIQAAQNIDPRDLLPLQIPWRELLIALGFVLGGYTLGLRADHLFQSASQARAIQSAIQGEIPRVEALRAKIEQDESLTPERRQDLSEPLERAQEELGRSQSLEQAVSALTRAEDELSALDSPEAQNAAGALQESGQRLSKGNDSALKSLGESLANQDFQSAAQKLNNFDLDSLSKTQRLDLAVELDQVAGSLATASPGLSSALQDASRYLDTGDIQSAGQALQQASEALSQAGQQIAQSQLVAESASELSQGRQRLAQAASDGSGQIAQTNQGQNSGTGQVGGQTQNPGRSGGQGSSRGSGQGAGTGGAGQANGNGDTPPGGEAGENPISQGNLPGDGGERLYEGIFPPQRIGGSGGVEVTLPQSGEPGSQVLGQGNVAPGQSGPSRVPYAEVFPAFQQAYRQAIQGEQIPPSLRPVIRDYFSALEP